MPRTKDFYDILLSWALVYIRAAQTPEEIDRVRKIADMMHNVPEALCLPWTEERDERVYSYIRDKARIHGLEDLLNGWEHSARRRTAEQAAQAPMTASAPHPAQST